ncbi:HNH endonuclease signature motif containing protein [Arthrobacter sp. R4-81]
MEGTGAWTRTGEALESPGGLEAAGALAAVAASVAILSRIIGPDFRGGADGPDGDYGQDSDPLRHQLDGCLDALAEVARFEAKAAALKVHLVGKYVEAAEALASPSVTARDATVQEMSTIAELACVLTVSERTAAALLDHARHLTTGLPLTLTALQRGSISWQHARIMCDETGNLDRAGTAALETHFLDPDSPDAARGCHIGELVPSRFRAKARTWRERQHPDSIETRHRKSVLDRRLEYTPDHDGMAWLSAYLPAAAAAGIWDRTTTAARAIQGPTECRTLTQLRADIAATWLLSNTGANGDTCRPGDTDLMEHHGARMVHAAVDGITDTMTDGSGTGGGDRMDVGGMVGTGLGMSVGGAGLGMGAGGGPVGVPSPRAQVLVTVPVLSLLGATDEPAMLDGYGPIPASMARELVADGADSFHRVLIDPRDGAPLEIGRTSYRIPKSMRQWLRLRDAKCPFPGCHNHSLDNEADHLLAWADGGTTGITNLGQPCRKHHHLKHSTSWTPSQATANQTPGWTAPSGRQYPSEQQDWQPPTWPEHTGLPAPNPDPDLDIDQDLGMPVEQDLEMYMDQGLDQDLAMPVDPFAEWFLLQPA